LSRLSEIFMCRYQRRGRPERGATTYNIWYKAWRARRVQQGLRPQLRAAKAQEEHIRADLDEALLRRETAVANVPFLLNELELVSRVAMNEIVACKLMGLFITL